MKFGTITAFVALLAAGTQALDCQTPSRHIAELQGNKLESALDGQTVVTAGVVTRTVGSLFYIQVRHRSRKHWR